MNEPEIQQKKINTWEQAPLYDWQFDLYYKNWEQQDKAYETVKKAITQCETNSPDTLRKILQDKNADIQAKLVISIVRTDIAPELAHEIILQVQQQDIWLTKNSIKFAGVLSGLSPTNSLGYKLIQHVLQYGPLTNWDETVAYDAALDKQIEKFLLLPSLSDDQQKELDILLQQHPSCGVLQAKKAFSLINKTSILPLSKVPLFFHLLEEAVKNGIPDKYKYFIANFPLNWRLTSTPESPLPNFEFNNDGYLLSSTYRIALENIFAFGLDLFCYLILSNQATKEKVSNTRSCNRHIYTSFPFLENKGYEQVTMHDITQAVNILMEILQDETEKEKLRQRNGQGCCVWLAISIASWCALGATAYWLWTMI